MSILQLRVSSPLCRDALHAILVGCTSYKKFVSMEFSPTPSNEDQLHIPSEGLGNVFL